MKREEFLSKIWSPYPQAGKGWLDAGQFAQVPFTDAKVAGRWQRLTESEGYLVSGGARIGIRWHEAQWLEPQREAVAFRSEWLEDGDLVCASIVSLTGRSGEIVAVADGVLLLCPAREPYQPPSRFDLTESRRWAAFLQSVRDFFSHADFTEAFTPTLVPSPGTEPFLDPFSTEWRLGSQSREYFLPTSPEFHLKKMLSLGWTRIFELKTCFRNGESGGHHQAEFWMLEWYRAYSDLDSIADDVEALIEHVGKTFGIKGVPKLKRRSMSELFAEAYDGFQLRPETSREELVALAGATGIPWNEGDSWDDIFFRLFLERIEPHLGQDGPLLVRGYPPSQAALARIGRDGFADRFEVYWGGLELANAFHELNDPDENEARFREDARKKAELGKRPMPVDEELVRALRHGLPPSGGIALGLDRLYMALFGIKEIADTRAFPLKA